MRDFVASSNDANRRLDRILRIFLENIPLGAIYAALRNGRVLVNGHRSKPDYRVCEGDIISASVSLLAPITRSSCHDNDVPTVGEASRLLEPLIILQGKDIVFINKPRGIPTHGPGSLDLIVRAWTRDEQEGSLSFTSGPLHRLDRNTSGIIAFSLSIYGAQTFTALLRKGEIHKTYLAFLEGRLETREIWEDTLARDEAGHISSISTEGGAIARTIIEPLIVSDRCTMARVGLETGRTHQIRVQSSAHGHPLVGDRKYGGGAVQGGYILHAEVLEFIGASPFPDLPRRIVAPLAIDDITRLGKEFGDREVEMLLCKEQQ